MKDRTAAELGRAAQDLAAARLLIEQGFAAQASSRAYYAAFHAARAALCELGEEPATHGGLIGRFGQRVVLEGGIDRQVGKLLGRLFDERNDADYSLLDVPAQDAEADVDDAERFVTAVERWIKAGST